MQTELKISNSTRSKMRCPKTHGTLDLTDEHFVSNNQPTARYPVIDGIPVLISDEDSIFSIEDFTKGVDTTFELNRSPIKDLFNKCIPSVTLNLKSKPNYQKLADLLPPGSTVLILGGSIIGEGMDALFNRDDLDIVSSDVSFGPATTFICDGHDIPFNDNSFDCVVVQAVLEHVLDPTRCVAEIHRVLNADGLVYAETPFMQQVHMHQYDFTRFTHLGHRRLFRHFEEIESGPTGGPGMALAWSWVYLLRSFTTSRYPSILLNAFAHYTSFFWKYLDYLVIDKPGSYDAASGLYFLGKKSDQTLSDKDLLLQFKGIP